MQIHQVKPEIHDPLHESPEGPLIWQVGAQGCRVRAHEHRAVVKFSAYHGARLTRESDLIRTRSDQHRASQRHRWPGVHVCSSLPGGWVGVILIEDDTGTIRLTSDLSPFREAL